MPKPNPAMALDLDGELSRAADGGWIIAFDRHIARPMDKVWAALTVPERIADWLGIATVDLRVGGRYRVEFGAGEDEPGIDGVITALSAPRLLEYRWPMPEGWDSRVRWELAPDGQGARLRFNHAFPPQAHDLVDLLSGWHDFLDMIVSAADGAPRAEWGAGWRAIDAGYRTRLRRQGMPDMADDAEGTVTEAGDRLYELRFERLYRFPIEKVWAAITDPERLADWLAQARVDLRLGGEFALTWPTLDHGMSGRIVALEPPRLLAWTWPDPNRPDGPSSAVRWELSEAPGGCRLVLTNTLIRAADLVGVAGGWHIHLEDLHTAVPSSPAPWSAEREQARLKRELDEIAPRYRAMLARDRAEAET